MHYRWLDITSLDGYVGCIRLNRPPVNALNLELVDELVSSLVALRDDDGVRVVVVTSSLPVFVAGADIAMMEQLASAKATGKMMAFLNQLQLVNVLLQDMPKPTIAAINGHAMGGGMEMALSCDFRFATTMARVGLPEIDLGLLAGSGGIQKLVQTVGKSKALEIMWCKPVLTAEEALAAGLVDRVCSPDELMQHVLEFCRTLASRPPLALAEIKRCVNEALEASRDKSLRKDLEGLAALFRTEAALEGLKAFRERRAPSFEKNAAEGR